MIEKIIEFSAKNRFAIALIYIVVIAWGIYSVINTPVDAIPDLSENQIIVYTEWMGRSPEIIENQITYPLTSNLQGLPKVKAVRSQSMFGMSFIYIIFEDNADVYWARDRVQERLNTAQSFLPNGVKPIMGPDGTGVGHIYWYHLKSEKRDLGELRAIQDYYLKYQLMNVQGVAEVASIGGFVKQYQIDINPDKLIEYDLTIDQIAGAVKASNRDVGGNNIDINDQEYFIRGLGYVTSISDLENIVLKSDGYGTPVYLKNVASVQFGGDTRRGLIDINGKGEAVGGIIVMRYGENAQVVIDRVKEKIGELKKGLPDDIDIIPSYDRSNLIQESIYTLKKALVEEAIVVSLIVMLFLFHFRSAIRILIELPVAVLISFILMHQFNITSNIMSLGGLIIAIGVLVDASIVMVENGYRNLAEAQKNKIPVDQIELSIRSAKQVGRAIFFSIAIIVVSFLPVFLLEGQEGKMFHPLAFTKTFALAGSAIISITLVPMLMTLFMKGNLRSEEKNVVSRFFQSIYRPLLKLALKYKKTTLGINIAALLITIPLIANMGSEFMPNLDEGSLLFMPTTLPNISITEAKRIVQMQDKIIKSVPEVSQVLGKVGRAETATDPAPISMIETIILLKPKSEWRKGKTKNDIIAELDSKLQFPGVVNGWTQPIINRINMLSTGVRTDLGIKVFGDNLDTLEQISIEVEKLIKPISGAADVFAERITGGKYIDIVINREAAARYGISVNDIQNLIETAIGGQNISTVIDGRRRFPIRVRFDQDSRMDVESIKKLLVSVPAKSANAFMAGISTQPSSGDEMSGMSGGESTTPSTAALPVYSNSYMHIPLGLVADIKITEGPPMIASENNMLRTIVYLNVRNRDMGSFVNEAKEILNNNLKLPKGYYISWSGQWENQIRAKDRLMLIMPLVFLIIYVMLYFVFKSFLEALLIMLSVPFALIGGVYLQAILGYNFSVAVWVGFIALYGVAVETGVVMVIYLHEALDKILLKKGDNITKEDIMDAAFDGAVLRLRPKLMTVATNLIGLIPIMWATGTGSDLAKPVAVPMIGGILTSAVHVLFVTPILFVMVKEYLRKRNKLKFSEMAAWMKH
jgi:copper/silver efflux system protein